MSAWFFRNSMQLVVTGARTAGYPSTPLTALTGTAVLLAPDTVTVLAGPVDATYTPESTGEYIATFANDGDTPAIGERVVYRVELVDPDEATTRYRVQGEAYVVERTADAAVGVPC